MDELLFKCLATGQGDEGDLPALEVLTKEYPYFPAPRLIYLKIVFDKNREMFPDVWKQHAMHVPDAKQLYRYLHRLQPFDHACGDATGMRRCVLPAAVYRLEDAFPEENTGEQAGHEEEDLIDAFIRKEPVMPKGSVEPNAPTPANEPRQECEEEYFSETLAKIYLRQKLYEKAIATYMKLSLKYPGKSIYFARLIEQVKERIK